MRWCASPRAQRGGMGLLKEGELPDDPGVTLRVPLLGRRAGNHFLRGGWRSGGSGEDADVTVNGGSIMHRSGGFTLIEITLVMVIAGLLFAIALPNMGALSESLAYRGAVRDVMSAGRVPAGNPRAPASPWTC